MTSLQLAMLNKSSAHPLDEVAENLFVGDIRAALDTELLRARGIRFVVSLVAEMAVAAPPTTSEGLHVLIPITDDEAGAQQLADVVQRVVDVIDGPALGQPVLVHCIAGQSRSVVVAAAVLLRRQPELQPSQALDMVKSKRKLAKPHPAFVAALHAL